MGYILNIETSTKNCSVSIAKEGKIISLIEQASENYSHGKQLHYFIKKAIKEASISLSDLSAIAVGKGPGSYTGLRIGVSAAKGLCFSLDLPLISISSLDSLARGIQKNEGFIIPIIDARRMEVYSAIFESNYKIKREIRAEIIDQTSFSSLITNSKVYLIGDAVEKCKDVLKSSKFEFYFSYPSAKDMVELSFDKYKKSDHENVAYFEPYYLKDFMVTPQKASTKY